MNLIKLTVMSATIVTTMVHGQISDEFQKRLQDDGFLKKL